MTSPKKICSRRNFLKSMGAAGIGTLIAPAMRLPEANAAAQVLDQVPTMPFGKTGDKDSILALGGDGSSSNRLMMHQSVKLWFGR